MLEKITWTEFFTVLAVAAVIYYAIIGYLFYRDEFKRLLRGAKKEKHTEEENDDGRETEKSGQQKDPGSAIEELEQVVNDIRSGILEKAGSGAGKSDLLSSISERLASYEGLRKPAFRVAITNFIMQQAEKINGVSFSEEELAAEWSRLLNR